MTRGGVPVQHAFPDSLIYFRNRFWQKDCGFFAALAERTTKFLH
jgi:hypothetical protein